MTKIWECSWNPGMILGILPYHWPLIQAANTYGMVTTSISNITMVSDTIHMMWMGRTIHHHAVTTTHDGPIWGVAWNPWLLLENKPHHCVVVEPPDPPGKNISSTLTIYKVFNNIHMMWMGRTIHYHDTITTAVGTDWGSWLNSCVIAGHHTIPLCSGWGCRLMRNGS